MGGNRGAGVGSDSGYGFGFGDSSGYGYGYGDCYGYGAVSGCGYGYIYVYGEGYGAEHGFGDSSSYGLGSSSSSSSGSGFGYVFGEDVGVCGKHPALYIRPWRLLSVGCEIHTLDEWIEHAEEIDEKHGDGIADETRALAMKLKGKVKQ